MAEEVDRPYVLEELHALRAAACDWRLSRGDVAVFAVLLKHADAEGLTFPGPSLIGGAAHLAVSNVKVSLKRLEAYRYIETERRGERRANRYWILESPKVPSQKTARLIRQAGRELGMRAGPVAKPSRGAREPKLGMRAGPDWEDGAAPTGYAGRLATGYAGRPQLGMRAGHELAFNSLLNSQAAPPQSVGRGKAEEQDDENPDMDQAA